ncbi:MAG: hypothetical protein HQL36_02170 [Alphaproteobacteria bacterium]|nr:hypothetical protein [Alphaproteobacteria bacterium]MBF0250118.1 hypothetical protein [Alphaproteobacteria bacterium]
MADTDDGNKRAFPGDDVMDELSAVVTHPLSVPRLTYILYLVATLTGFPMLIGLIVAYVARGEAQPWLRAHYTFLIRTFWYGLLLVGVGLVTFIVGVGMFLLWVLPLWYLIRIGRGWYLLEHRRAIDHPESVLFG